MKRFRFNKILILLLLCFVCSVFAACGGKSNDDSAITSESDKYIFLLDEYSIKDYDKSVSVTDANGKTVTVSENGSFIATTLGAYSVSTANGGYKVFVFEQNPPSEYLFSENIEGAVFVAGNTLSIPTAVIKNRVGIYKDYTVNLKKDDTVVASFSSAASAQAILRESGNYSLEYVNENVFGSVDKKTVEFSVVDEKTIILGEKIPEKVSVGQKITVDAFGYYLAQEYPAKLTVFKPSGSVFEGFEVSFNEAGVYSLGISAVVAGESVVKEYSVIAENSVDNLFSSPVNINYIQKDAALNEYCLGGDKAEKGILINAANSASSMYFSQIIDLKKYTISDDMFRAWINKADGQLDSLQITLIDAYDPSVNIRIKWWQNPWNAGMSYMHCSVNYQTYIGLSHNNGDIWGTYGSECGCNYTLFYPSASFNMQFDYANQRIYRDNAIIALDLLNIDNLPSGFVWNGFTTGEVYLRIDFLNCVNGGIFLTELGGRNVSEFDYTDFTDTNAIVFDNGVSEYPDGVKNVAYPLPNYIHNKAIPDYSVKIDVLFNGTLRNELLSGNGFIPDDTGAYTIVYKTVDSVGNAFEKSFVVNVKASPDPITVDGLPEEDTVNIMEYYSLPELNFGGGSGNLNVEYTLVSSQGEILPVDGKYFVSGKDDITVTVKVTDYLGFEKTETYTVKVNSDIRIFYSDTLPEYVFKGDTLNLNVKAVNYLTGNELKCIVYVNSNPVDGSAYVVPDNVSELKIIYFANGEGISEKSGTKTVKVLDRLNSVKDYVIVDKTVSKTVLSSGVVYYLNDSEYTMKMPYYLSANQFGFRFGFNAGKDNVEEMIFTLQDSVDQNAKVVFTLTDINTENVKVKVNGDNKTYYVSWQISSYKSKFGNAENIERYKGTSFKFTDILFDIGSLALTNGAGTEIAAVRYNFDGSVFKGFNSGAVKFSYEIKGVTAGTEFIVCMIGNQTFGYLVHGDDGVTDNNAPVIGFTEKLKTEGKLNDVYVIPSLKAYDVLSLSSTVKVTVYDPQGNTVIKNAKTDEEISFVLSKYGNYKITLQVSDMNGISDALNSYVKVEYDKPPEFTVNGVPEKNYKSGDTLKIPALEIKQNPDAGEITGYVYLRLPTGQLVSVKNEYTLTMKGEYNLIYRAVDSYYNVTRTVYSFVVE